VALGRRAFVAEKDREFAKLAKERLRLAAASADPLREQQAVTAQGG